MKLAAICTCCPGCDHPLAADQDGTPIEGQHAPCVNCHQSVSGRPADGRPPLRISPEG